MVQPRFRNMMVVWAVLALIVVIAAGAFYLGRRQGAVEETTRGSHTYQIASAAEQEPIPVETERVSLSNLPTYAEATGTVKSRTRADLSPKIVSTVRTISVHEGDRVVQGQILVTLDASDLQAQTAQSEAALRAAQYQVEAARTLAQLQRSQSDVGIAQAQAALEAARQQLAIVRTGPRRQERAQARLQVAQAEATFRNAEIEYQRMQRLYDQEVIPKQRLDAARTQYEVAKAAYEAAKQQAELVEEGSRIEEIRAAEERVRSAEEALRLAKASAAQNELREQQARAAAAEARRAAAALRLSRVTLGYSVLKAPFSGVVVARHADPGDLVAPGTPILTIEDAVYRLEADVPETYMPHLSVGQRVECTIDALPGSASARSVTAVISEIVPAGDAASRTFTVKADLPQMPGLKSGLFGRLRFPVDTKTSVTVPKSAVWERGGVTGVFVIDGQNTARVRLVKTGKTLDGRVEIVSGLSEGETVAVTNVGKLSDAAKVKALERRSILHRNRKLDSNQTARRIAHG
jgi:RND family efflux transporter MFP subunit